MKQNKVFTYGRHAVRDALLYAPRSLTKVYLDHKMVDTKLKRQIEASGVPIGKLSEGMARSDMKSGTSHQGIIGSISVPQLMQPYDAFMSGMTEVSPSSLVVLLGGVQDPQNVGALIRTAAGFGADAVLLPEKGQAQVSGSVLKVSAGMAFRLPLVTIPTIEIAVRDLKKKGYRVYALEGEGGMAISDVSFTGPSVFLLGNEGSGLAPHILALADATIAIPLDPRCESLNVAAAGAIALYSYRTKRPA